MIQGRSNYVYRINGTNKYVSLGLKEQYETTEIHVDVNIVHNDVLDCEAFKLWMPEYANADFVLEDGKYICGYGVEKMSKSKFNVVNPDDIIEKYGADTLRLYEMFLGPIELSKPWDTSGIEGVNKFLRKYWRLHFDKENNLDISEQAATKDEMKVLHTAIKKIEDDVLRFSFNTGVSAFMICVNDLSSLNCNKRQILEPLAQLLAPFAPHITEEIWHYLGHQNSIITDNYPKLDESYLVEDSFVYPVAFNGKRRYEITAAADADMKTVEKIALEDPRAEKYMEGKQISKVIVVPKRMVNIVLK
jgi:leucyl-tRNA synthetase